MKSANIFLTFLLSATVTTMAGQPAGKIIFSSVDFDDEPKLETQQTEVFRLVDELFLRVSLDEPLMKTYHSLDWEYPFDQARYNFNYALRIYVDGEQKDQWLLELPADEFRNDTKLPFVFQTSNLLLAARNANTVGLWYDFAGSLSEGMHDIKVQFIPVSVSTMNQPGPVLASGEFRLHVISEEKQTLLETKPPVLPQPTMVNETIEEEILEASENIFNHLVPLRAIITDAESDWSYRTDQYGNILRRYLIASVVYEDVAEGNCEVRSGVYYQDHEGYGRFGETFYLKTASGYADHDLPCEVDETLINRTEQ